MLSTIVAGILIALLELALTLLKFKREKGFYYKFYENKIVFHNSTFKKVVRVVDYKDFREVRYLQGFAQYKFNVGDIYIQTKDKNFFNRRIILKSIPNVEKEYNKILSLFGEK